MLATSEVRQRGGRCGSSVHRWRVADSGVALRSAARREAVGGATRRFTVRGRQRAARLVGLPPDGGGMAMHLVGRPPEGGGWRGRGRVRGARGQRRQCQPIQRDQAQY